MPLINDTNQARVEKMIQSLGLVAKSARSNHASKDEMWELLQPLLDVISGLLGAEAHRPDASETPSQEVPEEAPTPPTVAAAQSAADRAHQSPTHITIRDLAQTAPLKDLTYAMAVYLNRIDEELHK